jgi:hypothetical protein
LLEGLALLDLAAGASREQIGAALEAIPESERASRRRKTFGTTRAFFGAARTGEARLELRDGQGRVRITIDAPADGQPSIRMFDDTGKIIAQLPE